MDWISDGMVVVRTGDPRYHEASAGRARVLRIGSLTPEQVELALAPYIAHENRPWLRNIVSTYMTWAELMQHEHIATSDGRLPLTLAKADGRSYVLEIEPAAKRFGTVHFRLSPPALKNANAYWGGYLKKPPHTLYIQYNKCRNEPGNPSGSFEQFTKGVLKLADSRPTERIIVDLRYNSGGDPQIIAPLLRGLKARPALRAKGRLYTLIGSGTYSAAVFNAAALKDDLDAILVGGPTAGELTSYGGPHTLTLPNSKLAIRYSTSKVSVRRGARSPLIPDILVPPEQFDDFQALRDPVLEAALHHPLP